MNFSVNITDDEDVRLLPSEAYYSIGVYLAVTGIFGTLTNAMTIGMFLKEKLRTSVDILLMNLAIADLGMTAVCFPFIVTSNFSQKWVFMDIGCTVYGFLGFMFGNCSIMTLSAISLERYLIVCRNRSASILHRVSFLQKCLVGVWLYCFIWAVTPIAMDVGYAKEPFGTSCTVRWAGSRVKDKVFIVMLVVGVVLLNVLIMLYCYVNILYKCITELHEQRRQRHDAQLTKMCFLLVAVFLFCWLPYACISLWATFGYAHSIPTWLTVIPVLFAKLSACVNPLLYILYSSSYRKRYLGVLTCHSPNRIKNEETITMTPHKIKVEGRSDDGKYELRLDNGSTSRPGSSRLGDNLNNAV